MLEEARLDLEPFDDRTSEPGPLGVVPSMMGVVFIKVGDFEFTDDAEGKLLDVFDMRFEELAGPVFWNELKRN